ncbi:MerR family transcriptional regulator [Streptomonospora sp. PA3]|uniref:MerR family transcriptional regulator n=1 Tax=Streptomonospora sp. PA3 TaxID=2607326 RepID=UPI0012DC71BF|nr:MerR family transcriptional regulator [Streptomonospora sp. PA3]MUL41991.1 MerR family transcriptional regulator [Streptomonospora sp. PA3]
MRHSPDRPDTDPGPEDPDGEDRPVPLPKRGGGRAQAALPGRPHPGAVACSAVVAAAISGVPAAELRVYENRGLIASVRGPAGGRGYPPRDVERVLAVAELREQGLDLTLVKTVLTDESGPGSLGRGRRGAARESAVPAAATYGFPRATACGRAPGAARLPDIGR